MITEPQIRLWLARYLHKEVSLDQFEDWLVQQSWNMHQGSDGPSQKLASAIELRLAEYSSAHLSESQLRAELLPFVTTYSATVHFGQGDEPAPFYDAQNNEIIRQVFWGQTDSAVFQPLVDIQHVAVSV